MLQKTRKTHDPHAHTGICIYTVYVFIYAYNVICRTSRIKIKRKMNRMSSSLYVISTLTMDREKKENNNSGNL